MPIRVAGTPASSITQGQGKATRFIGHVGPGQGKGGRSRHGLPLCRHFRPRHARVLVRFAGRRRQGGGGAPIGMAGQNRQKNDVSHFCCLIWPVSEPGREERDNFHLSI